MKADMLQGGQTPNCPVICNGKQLLITKNAEDALRRFRPRIRADNRQYLWLDAICIDQTSTADKNRQVRLMVDIYRSALRVVVWLGQLPDTIVGPWFVYEQRSVCKAFARIAKDDATQWERPDSDIMNALILLTSFPYWSRIWTVQEMMANASCKLYCGGLPSIPVQKLEHAPPDYKRQVASHLHCPSEPRQKVSSLIETLVRNSASNPHDYIYGLRSVHPDLLAKIPIDYNRNVIDVYAEAARNMILAVGLEILFLTRHENKQHGCPSWLSDWSSRSPNLGTLVTSSTKNYIWRIPLYLHGTQSLASIKSSTSQTTTVL
jgi:hypothetical protein